MEVEMKIKIKFYLDNGDDFQGVRLATHLGLIKELRELGYKKYYGGVDEYDGVSTIVGINSNNPGGLKQREKNGLIGAYEGKV